MWKKLSAALLFLASNPLAQPRTEPPPDLDAYLSVDTNVPAPPPVEAPKAELGLKGAVDNRPATRTAEAVAEEMRANQAGLTEVYKRRKLKGSRVGRFFGVYLVIGPDGDVRKAEAEGISDKEFQAELEAVLLTWTFSRVRESKPLAFRFKHMDFLYRSEIRME